MWVVISRLLLKKLGPNKLITWIPVFASFFPGILLLPDIHANPALVIVGFWKFKIKFIITEFQISYRVRARVAFSITKLFLLNLLLFIINNYHLKTFL